MANVPTKEELYAKLCYLFNYPLQSFACVLNEIAKKDGGVQEEVKKVEVTTETKEEVTEQNEAVAQDEIKEVIEEAVQEMKAEIKEEIQEEVKEAIEEAVEEIKAEIKEETIVE